MFSVRYVKRHNATDRLEEYSWELNIDGVKCDLRDIMIIEKLGKKKTIQYNNIYDKLNKLYWIFKTKKYDIVTKLYNIGSCYFNCYIETLKLTVTIHDREILLNMKDINRFIVTWERMHKNAKNMEYKNGISTI